VVQYALLPHPLEEGGERLLAYSPWQVAQLAQEAALGRAVRRLVLSSGAAVAPEEVRAVELRLARALLGQSRRARRERVASRPENLPSAAEVAARLELQRAVADAVHALDEPYRSAIVHRYYDDRTPTEIAERLGVPVRTVETRLRRGLERLRARMDALHGGDRRKWCAGLLSLVLVDRSRDAWVGGGALLGAMAMTTKTIGIGAAIALTAFAAGWTLRPAPAPPRASAPVEPAEPPMRAVPPREAQLAERVLAHEARIAELERENARLREEAAAGGATRASVAPVPKGPRFTVADHEKALAAVDWSAAGEAFARLGPLLDALFAAMRGDRELAPEVLGDLQRWNGPLVTIAVGLSQAGVPGTEVNGAFTHPSVLVNLVHSALAKAGRPLTPEQEEAVSAIGHRYVDEDRRRLAGYPQGALAARKLVDEAELKERFVAEIAGVLTEEQRAILHPPGTRGWTNLDLFSSGVVLGPLLQPVVAGDRAALAAAAAEWHARALSLAADLRPALDAVALEWASRVDPAFLAEAMPAFAEHRMVRVERALESARLAAALREAIALRVPLAPESRKALEGLVQFQVPFARKSG